MAIFIEDFPTAEERAVLKLVCENSLKMFIKVMHYYNTGSYFTFKPFHNEVIKKLEAIGKHETTKNLLLNLPVGFGKSAIVEYFISWTTARNKNICNLYTSYSDKLIQKLSGEVIEIINSEPFASCWHYNLKKDKKSKANWSIDGSVGRAGLTAGSIGGTITGLDAGNPAVEGFCGAMIVDDPMKAGDEIYETKRDLVTEFFDRKLKTRLRRSDVPIILIMQRLHEEDLTGYIKFEGKFGTGMSADEKKKWKENWDCVTVKALVDDKSIWEEKVSTKTLIEERDRSPWVFYPQRQQEPNSNINTHFKGLHYEDNESRIYNGIGHVDKAFGGDDSTALTIANRVELFDDDNNYIKDEIIMFGKKWDKHIDECIDEINMWCEKFRCGTVYTENNDDKGYTAKNNDNFATYHESMNKHFKIMTYLYSNWKDIKFLKDTDDDYIRQIQSYEEKAKHDDCPDSAASVIRLLEGEGVEAVSGIMV